MTTKNYVHKPYLKKQSEVESYDHSLPFTHFAPKQQHLPRSLPERIYTFITNSDIDQIIESLKKSKVVALDYEANGTKIYHKSFVAVGMGLAWNSGRVYIQNTNPKVWSYLHERLLEVHGLVGHNLMYDGAVFYKYAGAHANWLACTYAMYRQLTNEGFFGQRWGLKSAQKELLLWEETNEKELDGWLIENGYVKNGLKQKANETTLDFKARYKIWLEDGGRYKARPDKGQMYRAPTKILAKYCLLDAESTYLLYVEMFAPLLEVFPEVTEYHSGDFMVLLRLLIEQYLRGMRVKPELLESRRKELLESITDITKQIRTHPESKRFIDEWEGRKIGDHLDKEPIKFKKLPKKPREPKKFKKNGDLSKSWTNWVERCELVENMAPEISVVWKNWEDKRQRIEAGLEKAYNFNLASGMQLRWLLYDRMFTYSIVREHIPGSQFQRVQYGIIELDNGNRKVRLDMSNAGANPVGESALLQMGEVGDLLNKLSGATKELSYVEGYKALLNHQQDEGIYTIHPNFKVPGTLTGRLSGNEPNIQQVPKSEGTMQCMVARKGYVWVQCDHNSLEQVVMAELSRDDSLMKLYGPGANANPLGEVTKTLTKQGIRWEVIGSELVVYA